ncbi:MAG: hypothetical protein OXH47_04620 [Paracoccaceae bacterium]|nr:hypothetical protein [Paracoccaceae bacterium]
MTERSPWRFYGREMEIEMLERDLEFLPDPHGKRNGRRQFSVLKIRGRRGLGKTRLIQEIIPRVPHGLPFVLYELPNPKRESTSIGAINQELLLKAGEVGLGEEMQGILQPVTQYTTDTYRFMDILQAYMKLGAVVVLDEFHLVKNLGLVSYAKQAIDQGIFGKDSHPGKIVLMGSHQQKLQDLFTASAPLYGKVNAHVHLHPWPLSTIMEMASEQGILKEPGKFLTLWTAYGGIPRNWERYCTDDRFAHLHSISDEKEWRMAFLMAEKTFLTEPMERFDARTFIELTSEVRDVLLWFGREHPRGAKLDLIPSELGSRAFKLEACEMLHTDLDLMDRYGPLLIRDNVRWKITDQYTLFQINIFRELMTPSDDRMALEFDKTPELARMMTIEGVGMESLATAFMAEQEGINWKQSTVWHTHVAGEGDIDVLAANTMVDPWKVWLGEAKRNEDQFNTDKIKNFQDRFLAKLGDGSQARKVQVADLGRVLFAPVFNSNKRDIFRKKGFEAIDIHDMARTYGIDPHPIANPDPEPDIEEIPKPAPGHSSMKP